MSSSERISSRARRISNDETESESEFTSDSTEPEESYSECSKNSDSKEHTIVTVMNDLWEIANRQDIDLKLKDKEIADLKKRLKKKTAKCKELKECYNDLKEKNNSLQYSNKDLSKELETVNNKFEKKKEKIESLNATINKNENTISEKEKQLTGLMEELNKLKTENSNLETKHKDDTEKNKELYSKVKRDYDKTVKKLEDMEEEFSNSEKKCKEIESQLNTYIQNNTSLTSDLEKKQNTIEKLGAELKEKKDECNEKQSNINELESELEKINGQLNDAKAQLDDTEKLLSQQQDYCKELEEKVKNGEEKMSEQKTELKNKDKKIKDYKQLCGACVLKETSDYEWFKKEENVLKLINTFETFNKNSFTTNITTNRANEEITASLTLSGDENKYLSLEIDKNSYKCVVRTISSNNKTLKTKSIEKNSYDEFLDALRDKLGIETDYTPVDKNSSYSLEQSMNDNVSHGSMYEPYKKLRVFRGYNFYEVQSTFKKVFGDKYKVVQRIDNLFNSEERTYECVVPGQFEDVIEICIGGPDGKYVTLSINENNDSKYSKIHCDTIESLEELFDDFKGSINKILKTSSNINKALEKFFDMFKKKGKFTSYSETINYKITRCFKFEPYLETEHRLELKIDDTNFIVYFDGSSVAAYSIDGNLEAGVVSFATSQKHFINAFRDNETVDQLRDKYLPNYQNATDPAWYSFPSNEDIKKYQKELKISMHLYIEGFEHNGYDGSRIISIIGSVIKKGISIVSDWKDSKFGNLENGDVTEIIDYERTRERWSIDSKRIIKELTDKCYAVVCSKEEEIYTDFSWTDFRDNCVGRIINYALLVLLNRGHWTFDEHDMAGRSAKIPSVLDKNGKKCIDYIRVE